MRILSVIIIFVLLLLTACGDLGEFNGALSVTVNTDVNIWNDPYIGDVIPDGILQVNDDGYSNLEYTIDGSDSDDIGTKKNFVYLYDTLGTGSKDYPVLYAASTENNNTALTIKNIAPGDYYVVVFYDFNGGGNKENQLNRYDRYTIYNGSDGAGSPLVADAVKITVYDCATECTPIALSLSINAANTLGRVETVDGGTGRIYRTVNP